MINLSSVVNNFSSKITMLKVSTKILNGRPVEQTEKKEIFGMVKPLKPEELQIDNINYSLQYLHYVGKDEVNIDDYIFFNNKKFKCFAKYDYSGFGFFKADFEEVQNE